MATVASLCTTNTIQHSTLLLRSSSTRRRIGNCVIRASHSAAEDANDTKNARSVRHVIITGGNCGGSAYGEGTRFRLAGKSATSGLSSTRIGKAIATDLAKRGMFITLACRSKEKGDTACVEISQVSGNAHVRTRVCDLASFNSVHKFAKEYQEEGLPLHILVNNAGIMACPQSYTEDGFEMQFGVNHLGHFLLTQLLLDNLSQSASSSGLHSRVVVLASAAERLGKLDFKDLNFTGSREYNRWVAYGQSKLANCLFSYELSQRCRTKNIRVTSNSMHPGIVDTELIRNVLPQMMVQKSMFPNLRGFIRKMIGLKTAEQGASTAVHLATSEALEGVSGLYFEDSQVRNPSSQAQDRKLASELWEVSERLTKTSLVTSNIS